MTSDTQLAQLRCEVLEARAEAIRARVPAAQAWIEPENAAVYAEAAAARDRLSLTNVDTPGPHAKDDAYHAREKALAALRAAKCVSATGAKR